MPAPARELRCFYRVEATVAAENHNLGGGFGREREFQRVISLEGDAGKIADVAPQRANPSLLRHHDGDWLAHDHRFFNRSFVVRRRYAKGRTPLANSGFWPEGFLDLLDLPRDGLPLLGGRTNQ